MLRIAIDCRMIGSGGIGSFISELIPCFLKDNECLLIGTHEQCSPFLRLQNVEFCFCDIKPFSFKESFNFPLEVLEKINNCEAYFTPYCNIPSGITIPIFSTIHDVVFLDVKELTGFFGRFIRKMFYKRAVNYSEAVFTVSNFSKERIQKHLNCKKPLKVIYNAAPSYLKEPFDTLPKKEDKILFVGNIKKHKGLKSLLEAFELARKKDSNFKSKLVIVGNFENFRTGDKEIVEKLQKLSSSASCIEFTGKISNNELKYLYAESKLLVQPSLYEGFGIPPLEAMTVGTQALISDIPVFKEIYGNLPVTFFRAGDSEDLANKLLESIKAESKPINLSVVEELYSYERSANIILESMAELIPLFKK
ncbi:glycosyltransferase family 1 protein [uncultured Treponema sp.]|uniref:glycosyltransferase family 4 protein n=1 Tax=uncultured Treponema sp. TaxID=162155 RepID=UPI0025D84877|nr:glycosyltransferase family 1 protein [uncultured Treponema sp.]